MKTVTVPSSAPALCPPAAALKLMSDARLARWAAKGSQPAFAVIFERHHQALHRYCQSIVGNSHDAADALQNTMLKAMRALPGETRTIALKPWLYRIAHNESITLLRSRRGHSDLDAAAHLGGSATDTIAESRERLRDLTADLGELTEQQRGTLLMRELGGLEFDEISAALQLTATAAKQSVYEARCALQSLEEGRAMDCDVIRRTLSDGDRRTLRNLKIRGHLRTCAGCRDFETALRQRPAHLAALTPALPLAAAASILQSLLGAGTGAGHGGGGLLAAISGGATSIGGTSLATKVATVAVIAASAGSGALYIAPDEPAQLADTPRITQQTAPAAPGTDATPGSRAQRDRERATRESASTNPTPEDSATGSAGNESAATQTQRPSDSAPSPAVAGRPARPAADAAPRGDQTVPEVAAGATARRPSDSAAPPAAAAYARPARPVAGTASEAAPVTLPPAAQTAGPPTMIAAPGAARVAPVAPVIPPRPR